MPGVSWSALALASVLPFALGYLWYGPLFGKMWMADSGVTLERVNAELKPAKVYGLAFLFGVAAAYALGLLLGPAPGLARATLTGLGLGLVFASFSIAINDLFEFRKTRLMLLNAGYHLVRFGLIGVSFGLLG